MCVSCNATMINGHYCHEHGCPDAWRDKTRNCQECGCDFKPRETSEIYCSPECLYLSVGLL